MVKLPVEDAAILHQTMEPDLRTDKLSFQHLSIDMKTRSEQVVLVACGSFNPPTMMHLRMLELAREALLDEGYEVVGGYMSPVNDAYGKTGLAAAEHRVRMCELATADSPFIMVDSWEAKQENHQRSLYVLQRVDAALNPPSALKDEKVRPLLVCGADLLESFAKPGVWLPEQLEAILRDYGVVCISRGDANARRFIHNDDLLYEHRKRVLVVDEWITNDISSSKLRQSISRGRSIKYLTPDSVIRYINEHALYQSVAQK